MKRVPKIIMGTLFCSTSVLVAYFYLPKAMNADFFQARPVVAVEALLLHGREFSGKNITVRGCVSDNPHGLMVYACPPGNEGIPVFAVQDTEYSRVYAKALRAGVESRGTLAVTLRGKYRETRDGRDRWLDVDEIEEY